MDELFLNGKKYSLSKLREQVVQRTAFAFSISRLKENLNQYFLDPQKIEMADLTKPVLIVQLKKEWIVLDGIYQLAKAIELGKTVVRVHVLSEPELHIALIQ